MTADIELTWAEFATAVNNGLMRWVDVMAQKRRGGGGRGLKRTWLTHLNDQVLGACGEIAYSKATGTYWPATVNTFKDGGDCARGVEVRTTRHPELGLPIRDADPLDRVYVLVIGEPPAMCVAGWIRGTDAPQVGRRSDPGGYGPALFVPPTALTPLPRRQEAAS